MFPLFYQKCLQANLTPAQYLNFEILVQLLQSYRIVQLEKLSALFSQPIKFESRRRNLQRFLKLPQLSAKLLWFPLIKYIIKQEFSQNTSASLSDKNRQQRRKLKKLRHLGHLLLVIDRTEWKGRNLFVASLILGKRALPVYWVLLDKQGSSNLGEQKKFLKPLLKLLKSYPIVIIGDREFHSVQLAAWLDERGIAFILRQKKSTSIQLEGTTEYQPLKSLQIKPGSKQFFSNVYHTQTHKLGAFNLATRWKRPYKKKKMKEPWYLLTNLDSLEKALSFYGARFGIEAMFKDCKTGGYNMEKTKVSEPRFLALVLLITIAYSLTIIRGQQMNIVPNRIYICRLKESPRATERHSDFWIGIYGAAWVEAMEKWSELAEALMSLKPQKRLYFLKGMKALRSIQQAL
jgi:hypothetical protein